jgi:hypothetical protein
LKIPATASIADATIPLLLGPELRFDDEELFFELDALLVEDEAFAFVLVPVDLDFACAGFDFDEADFPALDLDEVDFDAVLFFADDFGAAFVDFPADDLAEVFDDPDFDFVAPFFGLEDFLVVGISFSSPISDLSFK